LRSLKYFFTLKLLLLLQGAHLSNSFKLAVEVRQSEIDWLWLWMLLSILGETVILVAGRSWDREVWKL